MIKFPNFPRPWTKMTFISPQIFKSRKKAPHFCSIVKHYVNPVESTDHLKSTSAVKVNTVFTEHEGHCPEICRQWTHLAISTLPGWPVKCFLSRDVILLRVFSSLCCKGLAVLWCFSCSTKRITCCSWPSCTHRGDVMLHCLYAVSSGHTPLPPHCQLWSRYTATMLSALVIVTMLLKSAVVSDILPPCCYSQFWSVTHCHHAVTASSGQWHTVTMLSQPVLVSDTLSPCCHSQFWSVWHTVTMLSQPVLVSDTLSPCCHSQFWSVTHCHHAVTASSGQCDTLSPCCHSQLWSVWHTVTMLSQSALVQCSW